MLTRLLEHFLISALNRTVAPQKEKPEKVPVAPPSLDAAVIGHLIGDDGKVTGQEVALSAEARKRHLYLLGATGTGKTNLLLRLIESDIAHHRAFCVIDLRGDLVDRILLRLAAHAPPRGVARTIAPHGFARSGTRRRLQSANRRRRRL